MKEEQLTLNNILCIRADNMGDLLMSSPAIRALKETFNSKITVLTSSLSAKIAQLLEEIDDVITFDLPWVKNESAPEENQFFEVVSTLKEKQFDAAVIFTVYSQNPLPAAMLAYLAGIPVRIAYCRENPYDLLTHWVQDKEPYTFIRHQVKRDLDLVSTIGAFTDDYGISLEVKKEVWRSAQNKVFALGVDLSKPWLILHPGVSEKKREYPAKLWIEAAKELSKDFQLLFTGGLAEAGLTQYLANNTGEGAYSLGGKLDLEEFIALIDRAPLVVSVNTGAIHLAAAVNTPLVVLYAVTNPQHLPWKVAGKALYFDVPLELRSKNEVIRYVNNSLFSKPIPMVKPQEVVMAVYEILQGNKEAFPEVIALKDPAAPGFGIVSEDTECK